MYRPLDNDQSRSGRSFITGRKRGCDHCLWFSCLHRRDELTLQRIISESKTVVTQMTDLEEYRNEIDEIDSDIVRLFEKRMKVCEEVAEYKIQTGKKVIKSETEIQKIWTS